VPPKGRYAVITTMAAQGLPVEVCCRVLDVSVSGYYAWRTRTPSARSLRHVWLTDQIRAVHAASRGTYGSRRVHADLRLGHGIIVGYHAVQMLMRRAGIKGLPGSRRPWPKHETPTWQIWSTVTSPVRRRTCCGSPTSPSTRHGRALSPFQPGGGPRSRLGTQACRLST